ncbi:hypothetical protein [Saccharopolyspora elongata]|nr:hypothetical protein [Saccharopolyspora elongata]
MRVVAQPGLPRLAVDPRHHDVGKKLLDQAVQQGVFVLDTWW